MTALQFGRWSSIYTIGHIVDVEQSDLLQNVISVVQRSSSSCQAGELFYQPAVLTQQTPDLILIQIID